MKRNRAAANMLLGSMVLGACCLLPRAAALGAEVLNPGLEARLHIANTGEAWTDEWHVIDTAVAFPDGGRAGFYRRAGKQGNANPRTGRNGILYLYPEGTYRPARIARNNILLPAENPRLVLGVAANWNPRGDWELTVKVNGRQPFGKATVTGSKGWEDLWFDLSSYKGQQVDIVLEAGAANRPAPYVFIDYISITSGEAPAGSSSGPVPAGVEDSAESEEERGFFDRAYRYFLELLNIREDKRSRRMQDQIYQDRQAE